MKKNWLRKPIGTVTAVSLALSSALSLTQTVFATDDVEANATSFTVTTESIATDATIQTLLNVPVKPAMVSSLMLHLNLDELLNKVAGASTLEEAKKLVETYVAYDALMQTKEALTTSYLKAEADFKLIKAKHDAFDASTATEQEKVLNEVLYQIELGYIVTSGLLYGNIPYLVQPGLDDSANMIASAPVANFDSLSSEKQIELLQFVKETITNYLKKYGSSNPNIDAAFALYKSTVTSSTATLDDISKSAYGYGVAQFWVAPAVSYDFTNLNSRIETLTKTGNTSTPPTTSSTSTSQEVSSTSQSVSSTNQSVKILPKTGNENSLLLTLFGTLLLVVNMLIIFSKQVRIDKE